MAEQKKEVKILFTGGHARATGYAVIEEIRRRYPEWKVYWAGSVEVIVGTNVQSIESKMFPKMGVEFLPVVSGRIQRKFTFWTIPSLLKIPVGFLHAIYYLIKIRPSVVVSFGGFVAGPFVVASKILRIPIIVHEQTSKAGRANIFGSKFANKVLLARSTSIKYFPIHSRVIGNPVSKEIRDIKSKNSLQKTPTLLFTGGASGSRTINDVLRSVLPELLSKYRVIHQAGELQYSDFLALKSKLKPILRSNYEVFSTVESWVWADFVKKSDIIISRSGANIVSEIVISNRPSILIPIPFTYLDEQYANAKWASELGIAVILSQDLLTPKTLVEKINFVCRSWKKMVDSGLKRSSPDMNAHSEFVSEIATLI